MSRLLMTTLMLNVLCRIPSVIGINNPHRLMLPHQKLVDGKRYQISVSEGGEAPVASSSVSSSGEDIEEITAPMPGSVFKLICKEGDTVEEGDQLIILEAMKMEVPVKAPRSCTVAAVLVSAGDTITSGQVLLKIQ